MAGGFDESNGTGGTGENVVRSGGAGRGSSARFCVPLPNAIAIAEERSVQIDWTRYRVRLLESKALRCYKCQKEGHVAMASKAFAVACKCNQCGKEGHIVKNCAQKTQGEAEVNPQKT